MPERKTKVPYPTPESAPRDGIEVGIKESTERWSEVTLEDGSIIRLKATVFSAIRIDDEYDPEGNPIYVLKAGQVMTIVSTPTSLQKPQATKRIQ